MGNRGEKNGFNSYFTSSFSIKCASFHFRILFFTLLCIKFSPNSSVCLLFIIFAVISASCGTYWLIAWLGSFILPQLQMSIDRLIGCTRPGFNSSFFPGLSSAIFRGIWKKGYKVPTPIQRKVCGLHDCRFVLIHRNISHSINQSSFTVSV